MRLSQFFQYHAQLVDEIIATFRRAAFLIGRVRRGSTSNELSGDVSPETRVRKRVNDFASAHAKYHQPFCQFRWSHKSNCQLTIVNFQLSIAFLLCCLPLTAKASTYST